MAEAYNAGWRCPLNQFGLVKGDSHSFGRDIPPQDSNFFLPDDDESDPIKVNAVTGEVTLLQSMKGIPLDWNTFSGVERAL